MTRARKPFGTGDAVSMVGGEWGRPDASLATAVAAVAEARASLTALPTPTRDAAWRWPPLDEAA